MSLASAGAGCGGDETQPAVVPDAQPAAFRVDVAHPTADKPQSKLWHAHNHWWCWMPLSDGSRIMRRGAGDWSAAGDLEQQLSGLTGRADVWSDGQRVRAVLVSSDKLSVVGLLWDDETRGYRLEGTPVVWPIETGSHVETATITRDGSGRWWVAYDRDRVMWVRGSVDESGREWSEPLAVGLPAGRNDFCTVVALPGEVGVVWSDHVADAYRYRGHQNGRAVDDWDEMEVIAAAPGMADDHLHAAVAPDGTLCVATRTRGRQMMLHIRRTSGAWDSHSYGGRIGGKERGRPTAFFSSDSRRLYLCHSLVRHEGDERRANWIAGITLEMDSPRFGAETLLISTALPVSNPTGVKSSLPAGVAPLILAADGDGGVYEGRWPAGD